MRYRGWGLSLACMLLALALLQASDDRRTLAQSSTIFADDFELVMGWSANPGGADTALSGQWERGDPEQTSDTSGAKQLGTAAGGLNDLVTGRLAGGSVGANDIDGGSTSIRSPAFVLPANHEGLELSLDYYVAHGANSSTNDYLTIKVVGSTTGLVMSVRGAAANRNALWTRHKVSLNAYAGQMVYLLIEAADAGEASLFEAAVDNVLVARLPGQPSPTMRSVTSTRTATGLLPSATRSSTTAPSSNLALNKPASGSAPCNTTSETPPKAVDGLTTSKFCSLASTKWLQIDLGTTQSLNRFIIKHAGTGGESTTYNTRDFNIQTSIDGASWTTVVDVAGNTASSTTHTIAGTSARYVRLNVSMGAQSGANTARIYELEVYSVAVISTPTRTRTLTGAATATPTRTSTPTSAATRTPTRTSTPMSTQFKLLVFSKTAGFRHDAIPQAQSAIRQLGAANGFTVSETEDANAFTATNLSQYAAVVFLMTTGDVLNSTQQAAFEQYIRAGHGFVGVHSAADTEYSWPWYGGLVGAYFSAHPAIQPATIKVEDRLHPSTAHLPQLWSRTDEWYNYRSNPRGAVHVLATLDESSYSPGLGAMGADHPIAWCHQYDGGRSWYTGLGHTQASYSEQAFLQHLLGGIRWTAGAVAGSC